MDNLKKEYSWMGYVRNNGAMGIRNKVLVIYTVECASFVAREIVRLAGDPGILYWNVLSTFSWEISIIILAYLCATHFTCLS